jgi:hypothetical protein
MTTRRGMMGTDDMISVLKINFGNSLNFFGIFFFFRCRYCRRYRLLLKLNQVRIGIINFEDEIMNLLLKKFNDCVTLGDCRITLIDLIFSMMNSLILGSNDSIFLNHQSSKLIHLGDMSISFPIETSHSIDQLAHLTTQ